MEPDTEVSADLPNLDLVCPEKESTTSGIPLTLPQSASTSTESTNGIHPTFPQSSSTSTQSTSGLQETHPSSNAECIGSCPSSHDTGVASAPRHGSFSHIPSTSTQVYLHVNPAGREDNVDNRNTHSVRQSLPLGFLDSDIELDHLTPPRSPAVTTPCHSTVHLVRTPPGEQLEAPLGLSFRQHGIAFHRIGSSGPDFKPMPLRWPFHVFLFVLIAGLLGFLEYQVHHLLPHQALLLDPEAVKVHEAVAVPDPIPPKSDYPFQDKGTPYCRWYPPNIVFQSLGDNPSFDEFVLYERFWIDSTTPDSGWCPCVTVEGTGYVSPSDKGCNSVLMALFHIQQVHKTSYQIIYTSPYPPKTYLNYFATLDKLPDWAPWQAMSTDSGGDIFIPLEIRTLDLEAVKQTGMSLDVFGNSITAPDHTGFFYAMFPTGGAPTLSTTWWPVPMMSPQSTAAPIATRSASSAATSNSSLQASTAQVASTSSSRHKPVHREPGYFHPDTERQCCYYKRWKSANHHEYRYSKGG